MPAGGSPKLLRWCSLRLLLSLSSVFFARASAVLAPARLRGPLASTTWRFFGPQTFSLNTTGLPLIELDARDLARLEKTGRARADLTGAVVLLNLGDVPGAATAALTEGLYRTLEQAQVAAVLGLAGIATKRVRDERARRFVWQARAASSPARSPIDGSGRTAFAREHESRRDRVVDSRTHGERVAPVMAGLAVDRRHARSRAVSGLHCRCDGRHQPSCAPSARAPPRQRERARTLPTTQTGDGVGSRGARLSRPRRLLHGRPLLVQCNLAGLVPPPRVFGPLRMGAMDDGHDGGAAHASQRKRAANLTCTIARVFVTTGALEGRKQARGRAVAGPSEPASGFLGCTPRRRSFRIRSFSRSLSRA